MTTKCQKPGCSNDATVWYRLADDGASRLVIVCTEHGREIRESVNPWQMVGRGRMYKSIAEGSGR